LESIPALHFKQDSTSYLRAAYLMEEVGLETSYFRKEIRKLKKRLDDHMEIRGPNQRMAFHKYYKHFGLEEPFPLANGFLAGEISGRTDPYSLDRKGAYRLTHEIFVPYDFGAELDADFFSIQDTGIHKCSVVSPVMVSVSSEVMPSSGRLLNTSPHVSP